MLSFFSLVGERWKGKSGCQTLAVCSLLAASLPLAAGREPNGAKAVAGIDQTGHPAVFLESENGRGFVIAYDHVNSQSALRMEVKHDEARTWSPGSCDGTLYFTSVEIIYLEPGCHKKGFRYARTEVTAKFHGWSSTSSMGALYRNKWEQLNLHTPAGTYKFLVTCVDVGNPNSGKTYRKDACQAAGDLWQKWATLVTNDFPVAFNQFTAIVPGIPPPTVPQVAVSPTHGLQPGKPSPEGAQSSVQSSKKHENAGTEVVTPQGQTTLQAPSQAEATSRESEEDKHLFHDIKKGKLASVQQDLDRGADVNTRDKRDGSTPLMQAAEWGDADIVKMLLDHGADADAQNDLGQTVLNYVSPLNGEMKGLLTLAVVKEREALPTFEAEVNAGDAAVQAGRLQVAHQYYRTALQTLPEGAPHDAYEPLLEKIASVNLKLSEQEAEAGDAAFEQHKLQDALKDYQDALKSVPDNGSFDVKVSLQQKIMKVKLEPCEEEALSGDSAMKQGQVRKAFEYYLTAFRSLPDSAPSDIEKQLRVKIINAALQLNPPPAIPLALEEDTGDAAMKQGKVREAFQHYFLAFQSLRDEAPLENETQLREKIIKVAVRLSPPPAIPQEAMRHAAYAQAAVEEAGKDASASHLNDAVSELQKALRIAPWWGVQYKNLAYVLKKIERPDKAIQALQLYLLADPDAPDAQDTQMEIFRLQYEAAELAKQRQHAEGIAGYWKDERGGGYQISTQLSASGVHIEIEHGGMHFRGNIDSNGILQGTYEADSWDDDSLLPDTYVDPDNPHAHICNVPAGQGEVTGRIDADSTSITLEYVEPYKVHKAVKGCGLCVFSLPSTICTGVTAPGDSKRLILSR